MFFTVSRLADKIPKVNMGGGGAKLTAKYNKNFKHKKGGFHE
jgi:hypothetical protein